MASVDELRRQALNLSAEHRAELAHDLLLSLEPVCDDDTNEEWAREIERRSEAYQRGEATALDWRESVEQIREALRESRAV